MTESGNRGVEATRGRGVAGRILRVLARLLLALVVLLLGAWCALALYYLPLPGRPLWIAAAALLAFETLWATIAALARRRKRPLLVHFALCALVIGGGMLVPASNDRDWDPPYARLCHVELDGERATVHDVRDYRWRTDADYDVHYLDETFDLREIERVDIALSHWIEGGKIAHFMTSFGWKDGRQLVLSVETRREKGEAWNEIGGFFKQFELFCVVGTERDLFGGRVARHENVYVYPTRLAKADVRLMFLDVVARVNGLRVEPCFYNTLTENCQTSLLPTYEKYRFSQAFDLRLLLNGSADALAYENGAIDTTLSFEETRRRCHINPQVADDPYAADFSQRIRAGRKLR